MKNSKCETVQTYLCTEPLQPEPSKCLNHYLKCSLPFDVYRDFARAAVVKFRRRLRVLGLSQDQHQIFISRRHPQHGLCSEVLCNLIQKLKKEDDSYEIKNMKSEVIILSGGDANFNVRKNLLG